MKYNEKLCTIKHNVTHKVTSKTKENDTVATKYQERNLVYFCVITSPFSGLSYKSGRTGNFGLQVSGSLVISMTCIFRCCFNHQRICRPKVSIYANFHNFISLTYRIIS